MKIISVDSSTIYQSNSLCRGVQTFTSFISDKTQFIFLEEHLERLLKGADYLFPKEKWFNKKNEIKEFLKNEFVPSHYFRLNISDDQLVFFKTPHQPKDPFVKIAKAKSTKVSSIIPAYVKNANYMLADLEIKESKKDDVIFFDVNGNATEASTSNIFVLLDDKTFLTPKTSSMVLEGVTRKKLIEYLSSQNIKVQECNISQSELESAREIWLTNSIQGIRLVDSYGSLEMYKDKTIYQMTCYNFGRFGEKFNHE
ncbi:MAG: aminotransferase class IV [Bacteriovorax sp.]|nr:aminotransferase class IV [Bacteriovorax sp.]